MISIIGFIVLAGGVGHVITGLVIFRPQLEAISSDGFINAVLPHFDRRAALWFILFGVMVAMTGHLLIHASRVGDPTIVRIAGWYLLGVSSVGTLTQTRSPSSLLIVLSLALLGVSIAASVRTSSARRAESSSRTPGACHQRKATQTMRHTSSIRA